jgi:ubiquinone/menaquinone biosynthesis C-methylase UbiE
MQPTPPRCPRPPHARTLAAALIVGSLPGCQLSEAGRHAALETLQADARARSAERSALLEPVRLTVRTTSSSAGDAPEVQGEVLRHGDKVRVESWAGTKLSADGSIALYDGEQTHLWFVFGQRIQRGVSRQMELATEQERWWDLPVLAHPSAGLEGSDEVGGRPCHVIELPSDQPRLPDPTLARARPGMPWAPEDKSPEGRPSQIEPLFRELTSLYIDEETLLLLRMDGVGTALFGQGETQNSLVFSELREVAPGVLYPHSVELLSGGDSFARSTLESLSPKVELEPGAFDAAANNARIEIRAQDNNEEEYRRLIASQAIKQPKVEEDGRQQQLQRERVIGSLGIQPGDTVADIGAGTGFYTSQLAAAVGPTGTVWATDVNPTLVDFLVQRMAQPKHDPHGVVRPVENAWDDIQLPPESLDLALISNVGLSLYPNLASSNISISESIYRAIAPGGRLVIIEGRISGPRVKLASTGWAFVEAERAVPAHPSEGLSGPINSELDEIIIRNFERFGFELEQSLETLPPYVFLIFRKPSGPQSM